ncbi:hypothetical protein ACLB2K_016777 [Fragaria x ananassa]
MQPLLHLVTASGGATASGSGPGMERAPVRTERDRRRPVWWPDGRIPCRRRFGCGFGSRTNGGFRYVVCEGLVVVVVAAIQLWQGSFGSAEWFGMSCKLTALW